MSEMRQKEGDWYLMWLIVGTPGAIYVSKENGAGLLEGGPYETRDEAVAAIDEYEAANGEEYPDEPNWDALAERAFEARYAGTDMDLPDMEGHPELPESFWAGYAEATPEERAKAWA